jgi:VWFA-related protein
LETVKKEDPMKLFHFVILALALAAPAMAASAPVSVDQRPAPSSFVESIDVRAVNVEAVVTDRRGNRIKGLSAPDFQLFVDGREVPVDYFSEVVEGEVATPKAGAGAPEPAASPAPGGKVGTSYLVFVDDSFAIGIHRDLVLRRLSSELRLGPEDRMAVVAYDGRRIDLLSNWTGDPAAVRRTLEKAQERPALGIQRLAMRRTEGSSGDLIVDGGAAYSLYSEAESAVAAAAAAMRGVDLPREGRKVFLLLSGGWPLYSQQQLLADSLRDIPSISYTPRPEELFDRVTDTANLLGYTIYPVDVQGLDPESTWADVRASAPVETGFITSGWERGVHEVMEYLAESTGGKAVLNSARLNAFERVAADTRTYYWLGFTPEWRADGQRHEITVKVKHPGARLRARGGFSDLSRTARLELQAESLLLFGGGEDLGRIRVQTGKSRRAGLWLVELPVTLEIPAGAMTALETGDGYEVQAILSMGSLDKFGGRTRMENLPLRLTLPKAPAPGVYARYETTLKLRRGPQRLIFSVEDATGGGRAWADVELKP